MTSPLPKRLFPSQRASRPTGGFAIVEALIALLIFSIGALGLVGLQVTLTRASSSAKFRADAAYLAADLIGQMWIDASHLGSYNDANCSAYTNCQNWKDKVAATLPAGDATVAVNTTAGTATTGQVSVKITWTVPKEGTHTYITSAAVNPS